MAQGDDGDMHTKIFCKFTGSGLNNIFTVHLISTRMFMGITHNYYTPCPKEKIIHESGTQFSKPTIECLLLLIWLVTTN